MRIIVIENLRVCSATNIRARTGAISGVHCVINSLYNNIHNMIAW